MAISALAEDIKNFKAEIDEFVRLAGRRDSAIHVEATAIPKIISTEEAATRALRHTDDSVGKERRHMTLREMYIADGKRVEEVLEAGKENVVRDTARTLRRVKGCVKRMTETL